MLFAQRFAEPIARGEVDLTVRRWKRPQVRPGRPYRTLVRRLEVDEVSEIEPGRITVDEARRAGFETVDALITEAGRHAADGTPLFRGRFHRLDEPDPRSALAATPPSSEEAAVDVAAKLDAMNRRGGHGPWGWATLASSPSGGPGGLRLKGATIPRA